MTAAPSHDHHHGLRGAKAVAVATRMALEGWSPEDIRDHFGYDLSRSPDALRSSYCFDVSCQGSVPQALVYALVASSFEEAIRLAVSLGGDADTQAAIAGSVAEPLFGVPDAITSEVLSGCDTSLARSTTIALGRRQGSAGGC
jgi:ADP-ribosylglycohydrolase